MRSGLFLNRGDHLEWRPLPRAAQLAPAFCPVVADFDGNGTEDLFLSQNFFATRAGLARLDAGHGLLLAGDGQGNFTPRAAADSGLEIAGEQRGAATADFDQDGRADLVVTQNGAAIRLYRNVGARPGLRVQLVGPPGNPDGLGARLRLWQGERAGPARELSGGNGSLDSARTILSAPATGSGELRLEVRWPGGAVQSQAVAPGATHLSLRSPPN